MKLLGLLAWFACLVIEAGASEPTVLAHSIPPRATDPSLLTVDRIFGSEEFREEPAHLGLLHAGDSGSGRPGP